MAPPWFTQRTLTSPTTLALHRWSRPRWGTTTSLSLPHQRTFVEPNETFKLPRTPISTLCTGSLTRNFRIIFSFIDLLSHHPPLFPTISPSRWDPTLPMLLGETTPGTTLPRILSWSTAKPKVWAKLVLVGLSTIQSCPGIGPQARILPFRSLVILHGRDKTLQAKVSLDLILCLNFQSRSALWTPDTREGRSPSTNFWTRWSPMFSEAHRN